MNIGYLFDFLAVVTLVTWILGLTMSGALTPEFAGVALVLLVGLMAVGRAAGMGLIRTTFRIALPIASLAALVAWYGGRSGTAGREIVTGVISVVVLMFVFYVMLRGFFRGKRSR